MVSVKFPVILMKTARPVDETKITCHVARRPGKNGTLLSLLILQSAVKKCTWYAERKEHSDDLMYVQYVQVMGVYNTWKDIIMFIMCCPQWDGQCHYWRFSRPKEPHETAVEEKYLQNKHLMPMKWVCFRNMLTAFIYLSAFQDNPRTQTTQCNDVLGYVCKIFTTLPLAEVCSIQDWELACPFYLLSL